MQNRPDRPGFGGNQGQPPRQGGGYRPPETSFDWSSYLKGGYFLDGQIRDELILGAANDVARDLTSRGLTSSTLRSFFCVVRDVEARLRSGVPFADCRAEILRLQPRAAYVVGRKVAPPQFEVFIAKNVGLATADRDGFLKGMVQHLEAVVCYTARYSKEGRGS